jgi:hypothetical protein
MRPFSHEQARQGNAALMEAGMVNGDQALVRLTLGVIQFRDEIRVGFCPSIMKIEKKLRYGTAAEQMDIMAPADFPRYQPLIPILRGFQGLIRVRAVVTADSDIVTYEVVDHDNRVMMPLEYDRILTSELRHLSYGLHLQA